MSENKLGHPDAKHLIYQRQQNTFSSYITYIYMIVLLQFGLYASVILCIYALFTFNVPLIMTLIAISALQTLVPRNQAFINFNKKYVKPIQYFKKFHKYYQEPIKDDSKCLFSFHPHSVLAYGFLMNANACNDFLSKMTFLTSTFMLLVPIGGLILRMWGGQSVSNHNMIRLMKSGRSIGFLPGGFEQATITSSQELRIFIKKRKGFIKYAIEYGYTIYPVLVFNEHKAFYTFDYLKKFRIMLNKLKIPGVLYAGKWGPVLPNDIQLITVVGKGIKGINCTKEQIQRCHREYVQEIQRVYAKYKKLNKDSELVIY